MQVAWEDAGWQQTKEANTADSTRRKASSIGTSQTVALERMRLNSTMLSAFISLFHLLSITTHLHDYHIMRTETWIKECFCCCNKVIQCKANFSQSQAHWWTHTICPPTLPKRCGETELHCSTRGQATVRWFGERMTTSYSTYCQKVYFSFQKSLILV